MRCFLKLEIIGQGVVIKKIKKEKNYCVFTFQALEDALKRTFTTEVTIFFHVGHSGLASLNITSAVLAAAQIFPHSYSHLRTRSLKSWSKINKIIKGHNTLSKQRSRRVHCQSIQHKYTAEQRGCRSFYRTRGYNDVLHNEGRKALHNNKVQ